MKKHKTEPQKKKEKSFFVPKTVACAAPKMSLECLDRYEVLIGGCKKIDSYSPEETVVSTGSCAVRVTGQKLSISFSGEGKILLSGKILAIEFI